MEIEYVDIQSIKPYERNAKKHPEEQVEQIAKSIREFGFRQPIVVDKDGIIIIGHGRTLAAKKLGIKKVPVVRAEDLTEEQVKALRLIDNKTNESDWDFELLDVELDSISDLDMQEFGFDMSFSEDDDDEFDAEDDDGRRSHLHHNVFENQELQQFPWDNYYGIPTLKATKTYGDKFLRFCDWREIDDYSDYIAHFYYDDYKFISAWREPEKYLDRLKQFKAVIAPDFSLYTDFPRALQILSCYRRNWCGAYWAMQGIDVIPDVVWGDDQSWDFCFDGLPKNSVVAVSSVGVKRDKDWNGDSGDMFVDGYNEMLRRLKPIKILFYGDLIDGLDGDIIHIPSFYAERREGLNELSRLKKNKQ